jgi:small nuclear ribonucleoprotein (snRNP)-like protein
VLEKFLNKFSTLELKNGVVLQGFVSGISDRFLSLVEFDNSEIVVSLDSIIVIFLGISNIEKKEEKKESARDHVVYVGKPQIQPRDPDYESNYSYPFIPAPKEDFSMNIKQPNFKPKFERSGDEE